MSRLIENVIALTIPVAIAAAVIIAISLLLRRRALRKFDMRTSPLTKNLLRPAGYSLQKEIERLEDQFQDRFFDAIAAPLMFVLTCAVAPRPSDTSTMFWWTTIVVPLTAYELWALPRLINTLEKLRPLRLGLEGEQAVAAELNLLMLKGCRVYHDVPINYGNVDHVVISKSGVYAINTKSHGRLKSHESKGGEAKRVNIDHTNGTMQFPDRTIKIPDQVAVEADSLAKLLTSSVGIPVDVEAMLALPGWYIANRKGRGKVYVLNPENASQFFVKNESKLTEKLQNQIAHQLDQLCRDIDPLQKQDKSWRTTK